jgi:alpha-beta hydrolase superfamily lysophospholipase
VKGLKVFSFPDKNEVEVFCFKWYNEIISEPKAIIQIVHGMMEHAGRYAAFADYLLDNGHTIYASDHPGHGKTARTADELGYLNGKKGWLQVIDDIHALAKIIKNDYPSVPVILFGHSMGSMLARHYSFSYPDEIQGLILSGTNYSSKALSLFGSGLAGLTRNIYGNHHRSKVINYLTYKQFNRYFKPHETEFDWLSRDKEAVRKYIEDNLCGYPSTSALYSGMFYGMRQIVNSRNVDRITKDLPILIISGDHDPVGNFTKGVIKVRDLFEKAGLQNITLKLYENGRHEMLNEINKEDVYRDIHEWIEKYFGKQ